MKKGLFYILLLGMFVALGAGDLLAQSYKMDRAVMGSGGMISVKNSDGVSMSGIVGQTAIEKRVSTLNGNTENLYQGFWVPLGNVTDVPVTPAELSGSLSNYPNPVNNFTTFRYDIPGTANVSLKVFDLVGNVVKVLFEGYLDGGHQELNWNVKDNSGLDITSGSYFYELSVTPAQIAGAGFQSYTLRNVMIVVK